MNCRKYEADVVDRARGAVLSAPVKEGVDEHLARCPMCAARFAREQHLTAGLKALVKTAPQPSRSADIEQQLLRAFAARKALASVRRPVFAAPPARRWLAAAALLVVVAAGWWGSGRWSARGGTRPAEAGRHDMLGRYIPGRPEPVGAEAIARPADASAGAGLGAASTEAPTRTPGEVPPGGRTTRPQARPARDVVRRDVPGGEDQVLRFVALPAAAGLPGLESGRVVHLELPMAILPAYGLEVVPEDAARMVEADVLVGQDGQPRAIRFVILDPNSRRRQ